VTDPPRAAVWRLLLDRRFLVLLVVVACINSTWQLVRAWLPMFHQKGRGYSESDALYFNSVYYIATDVGCLAAGAATLWLARRGASVHSSRLIVFAYCAALTALTTVVSVTPAGPLLLSLLLIVAAGSLGLFPCYYSFTQELSARHMGKVTGLLGSWAWFVSSPLQKLFGRVVDQTGSYDTGIAVVGWPPTLALVVMLLFWRRSEPAGEKSR
jgi:sugar phosphate permease